MHVLLIEDRVPHAWLGAGFPRTLAVLRALVDLGHEVTLYALSSASVQDRGPANLPTGVTVASTCGPQGFEQYLASSHGSFDVVIVSRPHNMQTFATLRSAHPTWFERTSIIYDAEAIFSAREIKQRAVEDNPLPEHVANAMVAAEVTLASGVDAVLTVSRLERSMFVEHGATNVHVIGHAVDLAPTTTPFRQRSGFLFVGAMHTESSPNADAVRWFVTQVWPRVQAVLGSEVTFTVAGVNNAQSVNALASPTVRVLGAVDDLIELYRTARVFVAPTRYAAGIPLKIYEAAARGVPVVTTSLLASQLDWSHDELAIADTPADVAQRCIDVYRDEELWTQLRSAALARVAADGSFEQLRTALAGALASVARIHCS